jgi:hypothetical protein
MSTRSPAKARGGSGRQGARVEEARHKARRYGGASRAADVVGDDRGLAIAGGVTSNCWLAPSFSAAAATWWHGIWGPSRRRNRRRGAVNFQVAQPRLGPGMASTSPRRAFGFRRVGAAAALVEAMNAERRIPRSRRWVAPKVERDPRYRGAGARPRQTLVEALLDGMPTRLVHIAARRRSRASMLPGAGRGRSRSLR